MCFKKILAGTALLLVAAITPTNAGGAPRSLAAAECRICSVPGSKMRGQVIPEWTEVASRLVSLDSASELYEKDDGAAMTCEVWEAYAAGVHVLGAAVNNAAFCLDLRVWLERQCCAGLPPLYQCETAVQEALLRPEYGAHYMKDEAPITDGASMDVGVQLEASDVRIANFGVNGGAVELMGALHLGWTDERLTWNSSTAGCSSVAIMAEKIWVPELSPAVGDHCDGDCGDYDESVSGGSSFALSSASKAYVLSDGRVLWSRDGNLWIPCESRAGGSEKLCSVDLLDKNVGGGVHYYSNGLVVGESFSIPEYKLNATGYSLLTAERGARQDMHIELDFIPLVSDCNLCGHNGATLHNGTIRAYPLSWLEEFPETEEWSCAQLDALLATIDVMDTSCLMGRAFYEEACCDDSRSSYICESNIHDQMVEMHNTITTPDPSPREEDPIFASKDAVDVQVSLDVAHLLGIQIKSNSMEMLVSLDLDWYDQRLAWKPFTGGCHRVSYRASMDAEQTEIWVPNIELVNKVEGVQDLPEAHASVRYDGHVTWRRTGVLRASCDLSGIEQFPYDTSSCYLEFGGTRDPLYHRVNYRPALEEIEYGDRVKDESWNYQEYKIDIARTAVLNRTELLSGYENRLIRFQFFFRRAKNYYVNTFVLLYIFFTYLSFGMFYVDYQAGERLGYGSSMLFVLVAQDITLSDSTPVTQEFLWIYKLSFGSKMFVIAAIVQSVVVLFIYSHIIFVVSDETVGDGQDLESDGHLEERRAFLGDNGASHAADVLVENNGSGVAVDGDAKGSEQSVPCATTNLPLHVSDSESVAGPETEEEKNRQWRLQQSRWCLPLVSFIERYNPHPWDSESTRKLKQLRLADMSCALFFFLSYTIFIIVMFCILA